MKPSNASILSDLLRELGVPHTRTWSDRQFAAMTFPTWFGLTKLLGRYGVDSEGVILSDKEELSRLTPPFVAAMPGGNVIVTSVPSGGSGGDVAYLTAGVEERMPLADFVRDWGGKALLLFPRKDAAEPGLTSHRVIDFFNFAKKVVLWVLLAALFVWFFVTNHIWQSASHILVVCLDMAGLWLSWMLMQKTLHVRSATADKVCGVLQAGGCDSVLETKSATFFGIFSWSEVGFSYFSVSLLAMLLFPAQTSAWLALCNVCCLPFTVWSITYQKFKLKTWCTLCVSVQTTLWLLFFSYLLSGWWHELKTAPVMALVILAAMYVVVLLMSDALVDFIKGRDRTDSGTQ